ncbi:MAG: hypothetical protein AB7I68_03645 [Porticoccaceae bacterium]
MTLDDFSKLAAIISGISVVVTLIFLVVQIRINTKALRSNAIELFYNSYLEITADANRVPDVAVALRKAFADNDMNSGENHHLCVYIQRVCSSLERGLIMVKDDIIDQETFDMAIAPAKMTLSTSASRYWYFYLKEKRGLFRSELHELVENHYAELDGKAAITKLFPENCVGQVD